MCVRVGQLTPVLTLCSVLLVKWMVAKESVCKIKQGAVHLFHRRPVVVCSPCLD